jgi:hypothetical protein
VNRTDLSWGKDRDDLWADQPRGKEWWVMVWWGKCWGQGISDGFCVSNKDFDGKKSK